MRRLAGPWIATYESADGTKSWRVRWRWTPGGPDTTLSPTRSGFTTKGRAQAFAERLRDAEVGRDGWRFDERGHPTQAPAVAPIRVVEALRLYSRAHLPQVRPRQRQKISSVLARMCAVLLGGDATTQLDVALRAGAAGHPGESDADRAAAALREAVLVGAEPDKATRAAHSAGLEWLEAMSPALPGIGEDALGRVWAKLVTPYGYSTARTYWAVVQAFFTWLVSAGYIEANPCRTFARVRRDVAAERVDPERVPALEEILAVAERIAERHGPDEAMIVRIAFAAALRLGEALDLRASDLTKIDGRWQLRVVGQRDTASAARHRDPQRPGRTPTKEATHAPRPVRVPLGAWITASVDELMDRTDATGDEVLFVGTRGRPLGVDTFRDHWRQAVDEVFPAPHRLAGITPHACRHGGLTHWLRCGIDPKRAQVWGRWTSLAVMLDTYAGVLPSDDTAALARLDDGSYAGQLAGPEVHAETEAPDATTPDAAQVLDLAEHRRRRHSA